MWSERDPRLDNISKIVLRLTKTTKRDPQLKPQQTQTEHSDPHPRFVTQYHAKLFVLGSNSGG